MPDDKTLVVPQVSVNSQLGLPGDLNVDKDSKNKLSLGAKTYTSVSFQRHHHHLNRAAHLHQRGAGKRKQISRVQVR